MTTDQKLRTNDDQQTLYCRSTGRRLAPEQARQPAPGMAKAVAVFDDGVSLSLLGDSLLGRTPHLDRRVRSMTAAPVAIEDATQQISRCHVLLRFQGRQIDVIDLGSRNGTAVLGVDGEWHPVVPGLGVRIGDGQRIRIAERVFAVHVLRS